MVGRGGVRKRPASQAYSSTAKVKKSTPLQELKSASQANGKLRDCFFSNFFASKRPFYSHFSRMINKTGISFQIGYRSFIKLRPISLKSRSVLYWFWFQTINFISLFQLLGRGDKLLRLSASLSANKTNASKQQTHLTKQNSKARGKKRSTPSPKKRSPEEENSPPKIKKSTQRFSENENDEEQFSQSMLVDPVPSPMAEHDDADLNSSDDLFGDEAEKGDQSNDQSPEDTTLDAHEGGLQEHSISRNFESLQGPSLNNAKIITEKNNVPTEDGNGSRDGAGLPPDDPNAQGKK